MSMLEPLSTPQNALIFEVSDLSFAYNNEIDALDHVSLTVNPGETLAILGSNGSGKSSLLKILDGLYYPTSGLIRAFGQALTEQALRDDDFNFKFRSRVGFVFQDSDAQLFMPSVWEEVAFGPLQLGIAQDEVIRRVDRALAALKIEKLRERAPHQLSGGEKKRVALASVLSLSPAVWLLDEPTAGLDPRSVSWLIDFIRSQKTVVLATHDLEFVAAVANRVVVLDENHQVAATGTPDEILSNHTLLIRANLMRDESILETK
jgi:cobalt/nickel transport system ATP-binding protein